ncbi:MAG: carbohydrate ABC transporter permease [Oscillospiraceae bacterium]|jgi:sn-glycerol 3-phosphate transport system permease protein|nr:carbohydrate ABC transporter permease [Oscillospiraceae bacterium]
MVLRVVACLLLGLMMAAPVLYGFSISLMQERDIMSYPPKLFPVNSSLMNYAHVLRTIPIFRFIGNSAFVSLSVCLGQILTCSMAAYAFVFFRFKARGALFIAVLATMMIPGEATIIANFLTISSMGLSDTYQALILPFTTSAMGVFLVRQFYLTTPKELKEAAQIDGCGDIQFFAKILLPLSTPVLGALSVYTIINTWNQYMWPLLVTNTPEKRTVQIGISMLQFQESLSMGLINAGCICILAPSILFFAIGHKKMAQSLTAGAVKG